MFVLKLIFVCDTPISPFIVLKVESTIKDGVVVVFGVVIVVPV